MLQAKLAGIVRISLAYTTCGPAYRRCNIPMIIRIGIRTQDQIFKGKEVC